MEMKGKRKRMENPEHFLQALNPDSLKKILLVLALVVGLTGALLIPGSSVNLCQPSQVGVGQYALVIAVTAEHMPWVCITVDQVKQSTVLPMMTQMPCLGFGSPSILTSPTLTECRRR